MDIKYFKLIQTIAKEGNIANSSEKLFLTQSALSHQLKELEDKLGFKVFYRTRNKWKLTEEGIELHKIANQVLHTIEQGFNTIKQIKLGSKGVIKVSTECYSFYQGLSGFIQKIAILYPGIEVDLILEATHQPISKLLTKEIDIAIVTTKPSGDLLYSTKFFEDEIFAIMHKENILSTSQYINKVDFESMHLIIHSFPLETVSVYEQFLKPNKIIPVKISAIPLTEVSLEMVNANMGVMCMPKWSLQSIKIPKDLVFKRIGQHGINRSHYLVVRKEDKHKKYINDFIASFKEEFSD